MMRQIRWMKLWAAALGLLLWPTSVYAVQVSISGKPVPLPVRSSLESPVPQEGEENPEATETVRLKSLKVYGLANADTVAVSYQGDTFGYVDRTQFQQLLPKLHLEDLPDINPYTTLVGGSRGEEVVSLQEQLISLKLLEDTADGVFGNNTAAALRAFQEANGLAVTGTADPLTRLMVAGRAEKTLNKKIKLEYPSEVSVEDKFSSILGEVTANLEPFLGPEWLFTYHKETGSGSIDPGLPAGTPAVESPESDRMTLETAFQVVLAKNQTNGTIDLIPAMTVNASGNRRPYVQSVIFYDGNELCELPNAVNEGGLSGGRIYENAYLPLTDEAIQFLEEHQDVKARIKGIQQTFDFSLETDQEELSLFLDAVAGL